MRGKISDQDLTNYALNDGLQTRERLYVESMLGVSEACRTDVYRMLDIAEMLETGFEATDEETLPRLTAEQRAVLLNPPATTSPLAFLRYAGSSLALAACLAFVLVNSHSLQVDRHSRRVAAVSSEVSRMVSEAMASDESDISQWVNPPTVTMSDDDDSSALIQTSSEMPMPSETICTPPTVAQAGEYSIAE